MTKINANHNIFITKADLDSPMINIYIDEIKIIAPKDSGIIQYIKLELISTFLMVDMSHISFYLGLEFSKIKKIE